MKKVLVTMRVDDNSEYQERRDTLDQRWVNFFNFIGMFPVLLPNNMSWVKQYVKYESFDGILLTGGNSLCRYGGNAPERDAIEKYLLTLAANNTIPLLGVCRGMQLAQDCFNIPLQLINGHVGCRHTFNTIRESLISKCMKSETDINAYHTLGAYIDNEQLKTSLTASDGVVIALEHYIQPIYGIMWHPERENPFRTADRKLFQSIYNRSSDNHTNL